MWELDVLEVRKLYKYPVNMFSYINVGINIITNCRRYCLLALVWMVTSEGFIHIFKS